VLVGLVALLPFVSLTWLTAELLDKDRRLEIQQREERAEHAADRVVAASHQRLAALGAELGRLASSDGRSLPPHTTLVIAARDGITVVPAGALVYLPVAPRGATPAGDVFAEGEQREHVHNDPAAAANFFERLAHSEDPAVRAGALLRLGRTLRKAGLVHAALAAYDRLAAMDARPVEADLPAAVLALAAKGTLLEQLRKPEELAGVGWRLGDGLARGQWPLGRDAYEFYRGEARRWSATPESAEEREARARSAAYADIYERWTSGAQLPPTEWHIAEGAPLLVASAEREGSLFALIGGLPYLQDAWGDLAGAAVQLSAADGRVLAGGPFDAALPQAVRPSDTSRLPWTLRVAAGDGAAGGEGGASRRQLIITGFAIMTLILAGSGYFTVRGVARELAVARLQSDFVAAVSHEFRTPLASVRHLSDLLAQRRVAAEDDRQRCYDFLARESTRLERMVEGLLDFGRLEAGVYPFKFERVDAADLVRTIAADFQRQVAGQGVAVEVTIAPGRACMEADREVFSRAVWNLLDNAVKYSPASRTVWLRLEAAGSAIGITVRDEGLGIPQAEQQAIFGKFVRGSNARMEQINGTGVGLAIVRHIVEAHRGRISLESTPGRGSTFSIVVPAADEGRAA
jgi:signal transduction histidine kinase